LSNDVKPLRTARQIIQRMTVPHEQAMYLLGVRERRLTLYTQQVRALNLIYALWKTGRANENSRVAIIGGGAGGMTTAAAAARKLNAFDKPSGSIHLFERHAKLIPLLDGNHTRWLHPRIYDWPAPDSETP
jgi:hypothetical protein